MRGKGKSSTCSPPKRTWSYAAREGTTPGTPSFIGKKNTSGILRPGKTCVIGNGVVVDPIALVAEIEGLRKLGLKIDKNLLLSDCAHLVLPYHRLLDEQRELRKGRT